MAFGSPSLQKPYFLASSFDPAFDLPVVPELADDASPEDREYAAKQAKERIRTFDVACDTGNYGAITKPGERPSLFECRHIHGPKAVWLLGEIERRELNFSEQAQLAFRLGVIGCDIRGVNLKRGSDDMLTEDCLQDVYSIGRESGDPSLGAAIVLEIGARIWARANGVRPLS